MVSDKMKTRSITISLKPFSKYLLIAWAIIIITLSSTPSIPTLKIHTREFSIRLDYLIHVVEYGILAYLAFLSFAKNMLRLNPRKYLLITFLLIVFAFADEFHQKYIPGRSYNIYDFISNTAGIITALICYIMITRQIKNGINA